jgi:CheY-like chemotaxis protein
MSSVLLVDDDLDTLELYAISLEFMGYQPLLASSVEEALVQLRQQPPDIVVTDLGISRQSGWDLIEVIKADPATRHIPVIVVTGFAEISVLSRAQRAGCAAILVKPCVPDLLADALHCLLSPPPAGDGIHAHPHPHP